MMCNYGQDVDLPSQPHDSDKIGALDMFREKVSKMNEQKKELGKETNNSDISSPRKLEDKVLRATTDMSFSDFSESAVSVLGKPHFVVKGSFVDNKKFFLNIMAASEVTDFQDKYEEDVKGISSVPACIFLSDDEETLVDDSHLPIYNVVISHMYFERSWLEKNNIKSMTSAPTVLRIFKVIEQRWKVEIKKKFVIPIIKGRYKGENLIRTYRHLQVEGEELNGALAADRSDENERLSLGNTVNSHDEVLSTVSELSNTDLKVDNGHKERKGRNSGASISSIRSSLTRASFTDTVQSSVFGKGPSLSKPFMVRQSYMERIKKFEISEFESQEILMESCINPSVLRGWQCLLTNKDDTDRNDASNIGVIAALGKRPIKTYFYVVKNKGRPQWMRIKRGDKDGTQVRLTRMIHFED